MSHSLSAEQKAELEAWRTYYPYPIMGLLEALRCVQGWFRCVPPEVEPHLAELFSTSVAHVHEVATFFPFLTRKPAGRHRVGICRGLSCAMAGSKDISRCLEKSLGAREGETSPDGRFSWEEMECLGACDHAPALLVDERLKGKATEEAVAKLAENLK
ncbi:MAG: NAD(P)H-dependent oxidoreductase subunit E [Elusimicrobia bacterium]|nr:NAD(P)H-dependent oxidoreductase subunit E [Elusimicrobiota bacterium]MDE2236432.1 NAD(P)H-dependent oxidoreductase subunit E [Elusimicrobiota bacterium]MDE2424764.1 NAD(P)H-dependent oxidoreductase subunit E [Elusimicrobiota bacterium]